MWVFLCNILQSLSNRARFQFWTQLSHMNFPLDFPSLVYYYNYYFSECTVTNTHQVIINLGTSALLQLAAIDKFMLRVIGKKWCKMSVSFYYYFFFFPFVWGAPGRFHIIVMESSFMHLGNEIKICIVKNYSHDFSYRSAWRFFLPPFKL